MTMKKFLLAFILVIVMAQLGLDAFKSFCPYAKECCNQMQCNCPCCNGKCPCCPDRDAVVGDEADRRPHRPHRPHPKPAEAK